ncbi:hypothetical protein HAHE_26740 [Haloferula helveola]|uniref:Sulfatase N-terminal domain-containing protein n=1 Tax=Haloferula helveola TaxID=490095 RepID=A0ABN6H555_9BACT|nr:hypothetical protein HAHE_26740 [Haloferula helveola]
MTIRQLFPLTAALTLPLQATQIGINFHNSDVGSGHTVTAGDDAGLAPMDGSLWNQFGFAFGVATLNFSSALSDSDGTPNAATVSFNLNQSYVGNSGSSGGNPGDRSLMASYLSWDPVDGTNPEDTGNIAITGLGSDFTGPGYDVYVYFDSNVNDRTFTFTLNGVASTPCADASTWNGTYRGADGFPTDGNVAVFRNLLATDLTLDADSDTGRAAVNAIQIVSKDHPGFDAIHIAFHNGGTTATAMEPAQAPTLQGSVVNTIDDYWNNVVNNGGVTLSFTDFPLTTATGLGSGSDVDGLSGYSGFNGNNWANGSKDHVMMEGWYGFRDTEFLQFDNLPESVTSGGYHVVIYGDPGGAFRSMDYTIDDGGGPVTGNLTDNAVFAGSFDDGVNTVVFAGLTGSSFSLVGNPGAGDPRSAVNGIRIVAGDPPNPPQIDTFAADDHYVSPGTTVTLHWNAPTFDTLTLSFDATTIDAAALTAGGLGSYSFAATDTEEFTLTATNEEGSVSRTIRVGVGPPRPNILFFLVDDMGWQDTSEPFYYNSSGVPVVTPLNNRYRTPNMEILADRGMKFTTAYAMPVCTPTRNCWITGLNSARHHVTNWTNPAGTETTQNSTTTHNSPTSWERGGLSDTHTTLPSLLQNAGYRTIHAGKAHFGATAYAKEPLNIGFDVNIAGSEIGHPGSYSGDYGQSSSRPVPDLEEYHNTGTHLSEALTLEINKAIEASVNDGSPFFAYMAHYAVHTPFQTDPRFSANYPGLSGQELAYATLIEGMDKSLGDILTKLDQLGVAEDTLVVFMSDNGGDAPFASVNDSNAPLRHKKGSKYEGGVREPMIVSWAQPDAGNSFQAGLTIPSGSREDDMVAVFDFFPTFASVSGVPFTGDIDGHDLTPYFRADPGTHRPQELLIHFPHDHRSDYFTIFREGDWKLIYNYASDSYELYDLASDISEGTDLSGVEPERVMAMSRKMARQLADAGAQWPTFSSGGPDDPYAAPNLPAVDVDGDGIPDNMEDPNFNGLVDPGETDPDSDNTDGDPTLDGDEVRTGTDPLDPSSFFRVIPEQVDGDLILEWPSAPGALYRIESADTPDAAIWDEIADDVPASAGTETTYNLGAPGPEPRKFYRIVLK